MEAVVDMYRDIIKEKNEVALKRAELTGRVLAAASYLDMILTAKQRENPYYKSFEQAVKDLNDTYYKV